MHFVIRACDITRWADRSAFGTVARSRHIALFCLLIAAISLIACETRVVRYHPMLGGLPNSQSGMTVTGPRGEYTDPTRVEGPLTIENPDGSKKLIARSCRHLMLHIFNTLDTGDEALFLDQVLSTMTKDEYYARGMHPSEAFRTLNSRIPELMKLFRAMPMGEFTPGVYSEPVGGGVRRVQLTGMSAKDLSWTGIDMVMEKGNWRLRWFVGD